MLAVAAAAASASGVDAWLAAPSPAARGVNEQLGVAVVGVRGRGNSHLADYASRRDTRLLYVCDVDRQIGKLRVNQLTRRRRRGSPLWIEDFRRALDDPRVDVVSIATPNHWHALAAMWAMRAGKDVYVEVPVSHAMAEGRQMVNAARRCRRICQSGFQARSNPGMIEAIRFLRGGGIGTLRLARAFYHRKHRDGGGQHAPSVPAHLNYDLWLGPAPVAPIARRQFHYDWRWQWAYGSGELGNQAVHLLDICRWGLGWSVLPEQTLSWGTLASDADATTPPGTQVSVHASGDQSLVMEIRAGKRPARHPVRSGVLFEGTDGYVVLTSYRSGTAFDRAGRARRHFRSGGGGEPHFANFLNAVREGRCQKLNADIEEGHLSSTLVHAGNLSYRLGQTRSLPAASSELDDCEMNDEVMAAWERTKGQGLERSANEPSRVLRLGELLESDSLTERFPNARQADALLEGHYRYPFVLPPL